MTPAYVWHRAHSSYLERSHKGGAGLRIFTRLLLASFESYAQKIFTHFGRASTLQTFSAPFPVN
jgi:hypothetical protein